jgi:hypothetical protein
MLEREVKKQCLGWLNTLPSSFYYSSPVSRYGRSGIADITGVVSGFAIYIECKTPEAYKKKDYGMSAAQKEFKSKIYDAGGIYFTVDSVDRLRSLMSAHPSLLPGEMR